MDPRIGDNSASCPECGAPRLDGMTCWDQLGLLLAWEAEDSALAAEHFLTVASYNLQHPAQFTDEALAGLRAAFVEHLDRGMAVVEIRRHAGHAFAGTRRVLRDVGERRPLRRSWPMTIADVYIPDMPDGAAARVRAWAACIRSKL